MPMSQTIAICEQIEPMEFAAATMATEDADLVRSCQNGDQTAFRELVERYKQKAYWIAYDVVSHRETARDISQEAFIKAFKAIGTFDANNSFEGWMRRIVTNLAIDELRARGRKKDMSLEAVTGQAEMPSQAHGPAQEAERREVRELVIRILNKLPPKYRSILALREIHGMSYEDIAQTVSRPTATVRWRIHNARKLFKALWQKHVERDGGKED